MPFLTDILSDPGVQFGLGLLASNQGRNRREAFGNALQGGLQTYGWGEQLRSKREQEKLLAQLKVADLLKPIAVPRGAHLWDPRTGGMLGGGGADVPEYDNVTTDAYGNAWGLNKDTGQWVRLPGEPGFARAHYYTGSDPNTGMPVPMTTIFQGGQPAVNLGGQPGAPSAGAPPSMAPAPAAAPAAPAPPVSQAPQPGAVPGVPPSTGGPVPRTVQLGTPQIKPLSDKQSETIASTQALLPLLTQIETDLNNPDLQKLLSDFPGKINEFMGTPTWTAAALRSYAGPILKGLGVYSDESLNAVERLGVLQVTLLDLIRGAAVGPLEQNLFKRAIPVAGKSKEQNALSIDIWKTFLVDKDKAIEMIRRHKAEILRMPLPPGVPESVAVPEASSNPRALPQGTSINVMPPLPKGWSIRVVE